MLHRIYVFIILLLMFSNAAFAYSHGKVRSPGLAILNVGLGDISTGITTNLFKTSLVTPFSGATPAALDRNFPIRNFTGLFSGFVGGSTTALSTTGSWRLGWTAEYSCFKVSFIQAGIVTNVPAGVTITNGAGSGGVSVQGACTGQAGFVSITWNTTAALTYQFVGTYTQWSSNVSGGDFYIVREANVGWNGLSDAVAYAAGIWWTKEAVDLYSNLRPYAIRAMGWNAINGEGGANSNVTNFAYRKTTQNFSWSEQDYPSGARCGGSTTLCVATNTNNNITLAAATDTPLGGWVEGEQIQADVQTPIAGWSISAVGNNGGKCQLSTDASTAGMSPGGTVMVFGLGTNSNSTECNTQSTTILSVDSGSQITIDVNKGAGSCTGFGSGAGQCGPASAPAAVAYQQLTITGKSGGSKLITDNTGIPIKTSGYGSGFMTFTYDSVLDRVKLNSGSRGISNAIPLEAQVQLMNLVRTNFWYNFPAWATDDFVVQSLNTILANLSSDLFVAEEISNECWNPGQTCFQWMTQRGVKLGIATITSSPYQSLRVRQINGNLVPTTSNPSRVIRTYCIQGAPAGSETPFAGTSLASYGYNVYPNRPGDFVDWPCTAPYIGGGSAFSGSSPDTVAAPSNFDVTNLNQIVTYTNGGNPDAASAIIDGYVRGDLGNRDQAVTCNGTTTLTAVAHNLAVNLPLRFVGIGGTACSGLEPLRLYKVLSVPTADTFTVGNVIGATVSSAVNAGSAGSGTTRTFVLGQATSSAYSPYTIFAMMSGWFLHWAPVFTAPFPDGAGTRVLATAATLKVVNYEGNIEATAPTTAQCAALSPSINSTDCATISTAFDTWRNSVSWAGATTKFYYDAYVGAAPGVITTGITGNAYPSWLVVQGGGVYGMNNNGSFSSPSFRGYYYGFQSFSRQNYLLKRDIDPASNDNGPAGVPKAA